MSKNEIFGSQTGPAPDFLRNTYDKQFQKLITTDFGELRPCFCKEVLPGDSLKIDPMVAIRSHPIVFPINTRIKFYCHFFYGRNRILYKDFEDFIFNTREGLTPPLLQLSEARAKKMISTNSLGDNLGIPSTIGFADDLSESFSVTHWWLGISAFGLWKNRTFDDLNVHFVTSISKGNAFIRDNVNGPSSAANGFMFGGMTSLPFSSGVDSFTFKSLPFRSTLDVASVGSGKYLYTIFVRRNDRYLPLTCFGHLSVSFQRSDDKIVTSYTLEIDDLIRSYLSNYQDGDEFYFFFGSFDDNEDGTFKDDSPFFPLVPSSNYFLPSDISVILSEKGVFDATDDRFIKTNKFVGPNPTIPLSSLAMRLYEFCCNYYYRNDQNNPYILDGVPQYNKFIPTDEGGWDTNEYLIHKRNWESDPFTTAVPSPQYGTAPLVGLTYSGGDTARVMTNVTDSDGNTKQLGITVGVDTDGTLTSVMQVDTGVPSGSLRRLMDGVDGIRLGMSINDLRNVNSFQRFLENVIRRGLRYRNQLLSHFGVSVDYPDIDIPQFIGGFSGDLTVMEVTNMAESAYVALGDVAGKINAVISSNHSISIYCPEHGFVMGIFSIVPVPTYSQILPTMFTRYSYLDYFQKEFDKIGYVPIFHRNFLPLQTDDPNKILGYQRAWWDYMCSFDEVNGDFRTTLADFVLYRQFKEVPTLNEEFLKVDSESLNNIFAVDKVDEKYLNSKKFMCQFYFQYSHKNMVSKFGVASLE